MSGVEPPAVPLQCVFGARHGAKSGQVPEGTDTCFRTMPGKSRRSWSAQSPNKALPSAAAVSRFEQHCDIDGQQAAAHAGVQAAWVPLPQSLPATVPEPFLGSLEPVLPSCEPWRVNLARSIAMRALLGAI